jgi:hypothetical protein
MHGSDLLVHVYNSISHSDSVIVVPSFYFYFMVVGRGKDSLVIYHVWDSIFPIFISTLGLLATKSLL